MKFFILFVVIGFIIACSTTKKPLSGNRFYLEAEKYLKKYNYEISGDTTKTDFIIFQLYINKNKLEYSELPKLKDQLIMGGWEYNYDIEGYYWSFCKKETNDAIAIYYPNKKIDKLKNGEYIRGDLDQNKVYIWMTQYKDNGRYSEFTECYHNQSHGSM